MGELGVRANRGGERILADPCASSLVPMRRYTTRHHDVGHPGGGECRCAQLLEHKLAAQSGWTRIPRLPDVHGPGATSGAAESSRGDRGVLVVHARAVRCCRASYRCESERRDRQHAVYRDNDYHSTHPTARVAICNKWTTSGGAHLEPSQPSRVDMSAHVVVPERGTIALARGRAPTVGIMTRVQAEVVG